MSNRTHACAWDLKIIKKCHPPKQMYAMLHVSSHTSENCQKVFVSSAMLQLSTFVKLFKKLCFGGQKPATCPLST